MNADVIVHISFFSGFQKWTKLPKYLSNIREIDMCTYEFPKTTILPINGDVFDIFFNNTSEKLLKQVHAYMNF